VLPAVSQLPARLLGCLSPACDSLSRRIQSRV
jgi:hypothetical protein